MTQTAEAESTAIIISPAASALPVISVAQMQQALATYKQLQQALDAAMPDQIMDLEGRQFRKKGYWRAVRKAFGLSVIPIEERRVVSDKFNDNRENFGYVVTYRADGPDGCSATGDGACFAVEKARRFKCPHPHPTWAGKSFHFPHNTCPDFDPDYQWRSLPGEATEHNVRSHAHTRAFNRAVSNLVGFGEVSAEEVEDDVHATGTPAQPPARADGACTVKDVTPGEGTKPGRVVMSDGKAGTTFDKDLIEQAQAAKKSGALKIPKYEEKPGRAGGRPFINLVALVDPEPEPPPVEPDQPVTGPEKILTVRPLPGGAGRPGGWEIQTEERRLLTRDDALALKAEEYKLKNIRITPAFEVVQGKNKLTGMTPEQADRQADS